VRLLVTGGCGFIGSNYIHHVLEADSGVRVVNLDNLTYAGNLENLEGVQSRFGDRYAFVKGDIADADGVARLFEEHRFDAVVNFAAESHVDRSILDSSIFIRTNVAGTHTLLEMFRRFGGWRFVQVSTDEVYGSLGAEGRFTESTPLDPKSPYSASKAAADFLVRAYVNTHGTPAVITRCSNNYGPFQFPEKLIPLMITNVLNDLELPVYGDGLNVRDWIYVTDHCEAVDRVLREGSPGEVYNIGGDTELTNIQLVHSLVEEVCRQMGTDFEKKKSLIRFVSDRPGHDRRYAIDFSKLRSRMGWIPKHTFKQGLRKTVAWYLDHAPWWQRIRTGAYREYYRNMYGTRARIASPGDTPPGPSERMR